MEEIPTLELMNAQNSIQGNIQFNRQMLNDLTKAKEILKGYDMDNKRVNQILTKLDQDQAMFDKCVLELTKRAQSALNYDLETAKFDKLKEEVAGKFAEAVRIYQENLQKKQAEMGLPSQEGVIKIDNQGKA